MQQDVENQVKKSFEAFEQSYAASLAQLKAELLAGLSELKEELFEALAEPVDDKPSP